MYAQVRLLSSASSHPKNSKHVSFLWSDFLTFHPKTPAAMRTAATPKIVPIMSCTSRPSSSASGSGSSPTTAATALSSLALARALLLANKSLSYESQKPASSHDVHARSMSLLQQRSCLHGVLVQSRLPVQASPGAAADTSDGESPRESTIVATMNSVVLEYISFN